MIKYCKSCGKEYKGDYCEHCGYGKPDLEVKAYDKYKVNKPERFMTDEEKAQRAEELKAKREAVKKQENKTSSQRRKAQTKSSQWGFIIVAVLVFIAIVLFVLYEAGFIFQPKDKKEVITTYFESIETNDFEGYMSTMVKPMAEEYRSYADEKGLSDIEAMKELYADYIEGFGEGYTITVEYGAEETVSEAMIKNSENLLNTTYSQKFDITEAYRIATTVTFKGDKAEENQAMYVYVGKIGRKWYILNIDN